MALSARHTQLDSLHRREVGRLGVAPAVLFVLPFIKRGFRGTAFEEVGVLDLTRVIEDVKALHVLAVVDVRLRVRVSNHTGVDEIDARGIQGVANPVVREALNARRSDSGHRHHSSAHGSTRRVRPSDTRVCLRVLGPNNPCTRPVAADHRGAVLVVRRVVITRRPIDGGVRRRRCLQRHVGVSVRIRSGGLIRNLDTQLSSGDNLARMLRLNLRQTNTIRVKLRALRNIVQIRQRQSEGVRLRVNQSELACREVSGLLLRLTRS